MAGMGERSFRVLASVVAGLLVAGVLTATVGARVLDDARVSRTPAPVDPSLDFDTAVDDIRALVPALQRFVERARGLTFVADVNVTLLDDASFRARLDDDAESDLEEIGETSRVLRALGLIDHDVDLEDARNDLLGDAVAGFYDPETSELVVRGARPTALVRRVLVHELTHALQDQRFELHRPQLDDRDDEAGLGFTALVEGDAVRIERMYERQLPKKERRAAAREERAQTQGLLDSDIPPVLFQFLGFPYAAGPPFVEALIEAGGQTRLDAAFASPPVTTEQLLHPETFLAGDKGIEVKPPAADGDVFDQGVLGEFGLYVILSADLSPFEAGAAARGWAGDWYVAWDEGSDTCVRATIASDGASERRELRRALAKWADDHGDVAIDDDGALTTLTACG